MNYLTSVISIVPRLPPSIDGVGDYALNLARQLRKDFNIQTHFIVGNHQWQGASEIEDFPVSQVANSSANALLELLADDHQSSSILLHYVGYGYAQRGCPVWLVEALQCWKSLSSKRVLVTMFHELYASSKLPWQSSFWLSSLQKNLVSRLAQLSDRYITSKQSYADILVKLSNRKHTQIDTLPVFSNIGEPDKIPSDLSKRQLKLVIFGGVANRIRVYQESQNTLDYVCKSLDIKEILDIGIQTGITPSAIGNVPILELGKKSSQEISDILTDSFVGFLDYDSAYLAKSTIFAAYCSHRILPINAKGSKLVIDGIEVNKHYWFPESQSANLTDEFLQSIANEAYAWYQLHSLSSHTKLFARHLL